jgi:hypothetical protein
MKHDVLVWALEDIADDLILNSQKVSVTKKCRSRTWKIILLAATVMILLSGTVLAATYKIWSPGLASYLNADEQAQDVLLESGMTSLTSNPSVTLENGLTLTVEQVFCDGSETGVVVRYDAPEDGWLTSDNRSLATMYTFPSLTIGDTTLAQVGGGFDQASVADTTAYMIWMFEGDTAPWHGETATLVLTPPDDLKDVTEPIDADPLILTRAASLCWTLELSETISKTFEGGFTGVYNGHSLTIEDVTLTPISICFTLTEGLELNDPEQTDDALYPIGVVLADGTNVGWNSGHLGEVDAVPEGYEPESLPAYYAFDTAILDLDSIVGINFGAWADTSVNSERGEMIAYTLPLQ